jgi:gluconokinase
MLTCSALKRAIATCCAAYSPGLRFVFLDLDREAALKRVAGRGATHFFSPKLVDSQFATLERPDGEPGVLRVDATEPLPKLVSQVTAWALEPEDRPSSPAATR